LSGRSFGSRRQPGVSPGCFLFANFMSFSSSVSRLKRHAPPRKAAAAYVAATKERNAFNPTQNGFEFSISEIEEFLTGPDLIKLAICQGGLKFHAQTVANRRPRKLLGCAR
jgi:hypothetical protein